MIRSLSASWSTGRAFAKAMSEIKVILGTGDIGRGALAEDGPCFEVLDGFFSRGFNELDTAIMYAGGKSEQVIGRYMKEKQLRDKVVVGTKANPFSSALTREGVLKQANASLNSLQTPCVDIFYLHAPDHNTPMEETLEAVQQLYTEGKFKKFALSNHASWEVVKVYYICKSKGWVLPTIYQGMYNPITRMVEAELFPALRDLGMQFYAYNPLAGGLLTGRYSKADMDKEQEGRFWTVGGEWAKKYRDRFWRESTFDGVELVQGTLDEVYGKGQVSLVQAAFRWMNHHSQLKKSDGIIIGCSKRDHLVANLDACEGGPLDARVVQAFDKAWELDKANCVNYYR